MKKDQPTGVVDAVPVLTPEALADHSFPSAFRGFAPEEVRRVLARVGVLWAEAEARLGQLERELSEARRQFRPGAMDEAELTAGLGDHAARLIATAREAAAAIVSEAEEKAAEVARTADVSAERLRREAETLLARRAEEADGLAQDMRLTAEGEIRAMREAARTEAESTVRAARANGREMVAEAKAVRERMLGDLNRRKRLGELQLDQLRSGRARLVEAFEVARKALDEVAAELAATDPEGRGATAAAVRAAAAAVAAEDEVRVRPSHRIRQSPLASLPLPSPSALAAVDPVPTVLPELRPQRGDGPPPAVRVVPPSPAAGSGAAAASGTWPSSTDSPRRRIRSGPLMRPVAPEESPKLRPQSVADAVPGRLLAPVPSARTTGPPAPPSPEEDTAPPLPAAAETDVEAPPPDDPPVAGSPGPDPSPEGAAVAPTRPSTRSRKSPAGADRASAAAARSSKRPGRTPAERPASPAKPKVPARRAPSRTSRTAAPRAELAGDVHVEPAAGVAVTVVGRTSQPIEELFARIRADQRQGAPVVADEADPAEGAVAPESVTPTSAEESDGQDVARPLPPELAGDEVALARRDHALDPLETQLAKALRRTLQDEQSEVLDRLRRLRSGSGPLLPDPVEQIERFALAALGPLTAATAGGAHFAGSASSGDLDVAPLAEAMALAFVEPLRARVTVLVEAVDDDGTIERVDTTERVSAVYRQAKLKRIQPLVRDHLSLAFNRGAFAATAAGTPLRWIVDDEDGECPDCDDNALAGAVARGEEFPTGQAHPPAHPGCRCLLVPTVL